jgi:hypothetical protein
MDLDLHLIPNYDSKLRFQIAIPNYDSELRFREFCHGLGWHAWTKIWRLCSVLSRGAARLGMIHVTRSISTSTCDAIEAVL